MGFARRSYQPRHAEASVLHIVIREHLDNFLRAAADRADGAGLPAFVAREFREFLTCGVLAHCFARVRCEGCAFEHLVPFSCKDRGFCPSCGGRRMTERAAHLVDEVLPPVPVRQWVLTLPYRLRYLLAWDHGLSRAVLAVYARALLDFYGDQARRHGIPGGRTGTLTVIQRFGAGLNLNVHFHTLAFDGVFVRSRHGRSSSTPPFRRATRRWSRCSARSGDGSAAPGGTPEAAHRATRTLARRTPDGHCARPGARPGAWWRGASAGRPGGRPGGSPRSR
jgi:hypothetical protein